MSADARASLDGLPAMPPAALHALRTAVRLGPDGDARLRDAGYDAGRTLYDDFTMWYAARAGAGDPAGASLPAFGAALGAWAAALHWGALALETGDGADTLGLPVFRATGWFEVESPVRDDGGEQFPGCHFTTGLLAGFLGRLSGRPLAVLEVECGSRGDTACRFVVGGEPALARLYAARYAG